MSNITLPNAKAFTDFLGTIHLSFDHLDIGNNSTYQHMITAMENHPDWEAISEWLYTQPLDEDVIVTASINFGLRLQELTCMSDLYDHIR
jgi:hypothetical protein